MENVEQAPEIKENSKSRNVKIVVIVLAFLVIIFVAARMAYSYFTATIVGDPVKEEIQTGILDVAFEASEYFNNSNMMLINDSNKATEAESINFTVEHGNDATVAAKYKIELKDINVTNNFKSQYLKYELLLNNGVVTSGNLENIGTSTSLTLVSNTSLPLASSHEYTLRVWLSESGGDQLNLLEGSLQFKVSVTAVNS